MSEIVKTNVRCPKCKSKTIDLVESGTWTSLFSVVDGKFDRKSGEHWPESVDRLDARCRCGHNWRVRGAYQIDDAIAHAPATSSPGEK